MSFTQKVLVPLTDQNDTGDIAHKNVFESEGDRIALIGFSMPAMIGASSPAPYVASASSTLTTYAAWKAFSDDLSDINNCWISNAVTAWLKIDLGLGGIVTDYNLTAMNHAAGPNRAPKDWTIEGSDTGAFSGEETVLDTRTGITGWSAGETKNYNFSNSTSYRYYRIDVTLNNGDASYVAIQELELYAGYPTGSPSPVTVWIALPVDAVVDISTAKCWMFKDTVLQAAGNTDIKFKYAANNGSLGSALTLTALRAESDSTISNATNSFQAVGVYASDGTYESESSAWLECDVVFPSAGAGGAPGSSNMSGGLI